MAIWKPNPTKNTAPKKESVKVTKGSTSITGIIPRPVEGDGVERKTGKEWASSSYIIPVSLEWFDDKPITHREFIDMVIRVESTPNWELISKDVVETPVGYGSYEKETLYG